MADKTVEELRNLALELGRLGFKLRHGVGESMCHLHVLAPELLKQLHIMVAGNAQGSTSLHHPHHQAKHVRYLRTPVYEVAEEDRLAAHWHSDFVAVAVPLHRVTKRRHQFLQLVEAAMHVADYVEWPVLFATIRPHRLALDLQSVQFLRRLEDVDSPEALPFESTKRSAQLLCLIAHDMRTEIAVRSVPIPCLAELFWEVEHNRDRQHVKLASQCDERLPRVRLDVSRVDDRQPPRRKSLAGDEVEYLERLLSCGLIVLVIRYQSATVVGRQNLCRLKVLTSERRFPAARRTDEQDQREFGNRDLHKCRLPVSLSYVDWRSRTNKSESAAFAFGSSRRCDRSEADSNSVRRRSYS